jgi:hypothetical protein
MVGTCEAGARGGRDERDWRDMLEIPSAHVAHFPHVLSRKLLADFFSTLLSALEAGLQKRSS